MAGGTSSGCSFRWLESSSSRATGYTQHSRRPERTPGAGPCKQGNRQTAAPTTGLLCLLHYAHVKGAVMALREELDEVLAGLERIVEWRVAMLVKLDGLEARLEAQLPVDTPSTSRQGRREGLD